MQTGWDEVIVDLSTIEVIIAGVFMVLSSLLGAFVANRFSDRKLNAVINRKIGELNNTTLSGQHDNLLEQSKALSNDNKKLSANIDRVSYKVESVSKESKETFVKVCDIDKYLYGNEKEQQNFYNNLDDTQKNIKSSLEKTADLLNDWQKVITYNKELIEENSLLKEQLREMSLLQQKNTARKDRGFDR